MPLSLLESERPTHFIQSSVEGNCMNVFVQDELSPILGVVHNCHHFHERTQRTLFGDPLPKAYFENVDLE